MPQGKCKAGHYTVNDVVLHGAIVCSGWPGKDGRCKWYEDCLKDFGFRLSKDDRRIKIKRIKNG